MKLKLSYPLKQWKVYYPFGFVSPVYTALGLKGHNGLDLMALEGTPVYAAHDGKVTYAGYDGASGLILVIRTEEKFDDKDGAPQYWKTIYGHLKTGSLKVTASQKVKTGDLIALADNTGASTGSHLHFGLKPIAQGEQDWLWENTQQNNGYFGAVDPTPYFEVNFFKIQEFVSRKIYTDWGDNSIWFVDPRVVKLANFIRTFFGRGVTINNWLWNGNYDQRGFREPESTTGGKLSQHRFGRAIDINVKGMTALEVYNAILANEKVFMEAGLTCMEDIADTPTWCHLDVRETGLNKVLIVKP